MCLVSTFIQVHTDWQKYWHVLQCSFMSPYSYCQIYSLAEYLVNGHLVSALIWPLLRTGLHTGLRTRPNRLVPTDPANVELSSRHFPISVLWPKYIKNGIANFESRSDLAMSKLETTLRIRFITLAMFYSTKNVSKPTLRMSCMFRPSQRILSVSAKLLNKAWKYDLTKVVA